MSFVIHFCVCNTVITVGLLFVFPHGTDEDNPPTTMASTVYLVLHLPARFLHLLQSAGQALARKRFAISCR